MEFRLELFRVLCSAKKLFYPWFLNLVAVGLSNDFCDWYCISESQRTEDVREEKRDHRENLNNTIHIVTI